MLQKICNAFENCFALHFQSGALKSSMEGKKIESAFFVRKVLHIHNRASRPVVENVILQSFLTKNTMFVFTCVIVILRMAYLQYLPQQRPK